MMEQILEKFKEFLGQLNLGAGLEITMDTKLLEIGADSIALMTLLVFVEEEYQIVPDEDVLINADFQTVGDIVTYIKSACDAK